MGKETNISKYLKTRYEVIKQLNNLVTLIIKIGDANNLDILINTLVELDSYPSQEVVAELNALIQTIIKGGNKPADKFGGEATIDISGLASLFQGLAHTIDIQNTFDIGGLIKVVQKTASSLGAITNIKVKTVVDFLQKLVSNIDIDESINTNIVLDVLQQLSNIIYLSHTNIGVDIDNDIQTMFSTESLTHTNIMFDIKSVLNIFHSILSELDSLDTGIDIKAIINTIVVLITEVDDIEINLDTTGLINASNSIDLKQQYVDVIVGVILGGILTNITTILHTQDLKIGFVGEVDNIESQPSIKVESGVAGFLNTGFNSNILTYPILRLVLYTMYYSIQALCKILTPISLLLKAQGDSEFNLKLNEVDLNDFSGIVIGSVITSLTSLNKVILEQAHKIVAEESTTIIDINILIQLLQSGSMEILIDRLLQFSAVVEGLTAVEVQPNLNIYQGVVGELKRLIIGMLYHYKDNQLTELDGLTLSQLDYVVY